MEGVGQGRDRRQRKTDQNCAAFCLLGYAWKSQSEEMTPTIGVPAVLPPATAQNMVSPWASIGLPTLAVVVAVWGMGWRVIVHLDRKIDRLDGKIDRLDGKIDGVRRELSSEIGRVHARIDGLYRQPFAQQAARTE